MRATEMVDELNAINAAFRDLARLIQLASVAALVNNQSVDGIEGK